MGEVIQFAQLEHTNSEHAYQVMQHAITARREAFIGEYEAGRFGSEFQTYEDELDRAVYITLGQFRTGNQEAFKKAKQELDSETTFQLQTAIGERLNVGLSTYTFSIEDGELKTEQTGRPVVAMIDRGRKTRNAQVDRKLEKGEISLQVAMQIKERHDAEVTQFEKIQKEFTQSDDKGNLPSVGKTIISISPPGPGYAHNFYDVFVLKQKADGTRYVEAKRYASGLTAEDSLKQLQIIKPEYGMQWENVSLSPNLLGEPFVIDDPLHMLFGNPDGIHAHIQGDDKGMTESDFALVKEAIAGIISVYLNEVFEHPESNSDNIDRHGEILDALKNKADEVAANIKALRGQSAKTLLRRDNFTKIDKDERLTQTYAAAIADINRLGSQSVRTVTTGCGISGSSRKNKGISQLGSPLEFNLPGNLSPFGLQDGILNEDQEWFTCPKCHYKADGPVGNECPGCGLTKDEYDGEKCA